MTLAEMADAYRAGATIAQLATRTHRCESSVRRVLDALGVERRPPGGSDLQLPQAEIRRTINLYREHGTKRAASMLGISRQAVRARLRSAGEPRTQSGRQPHRPVPAGFETVDTTAARLGVTATRIRSMCRTGRFPGAFIDPDPRPRWLLPVSAQEDA